MQKSSQNVYKFEKSHRKDHNAPSISDDYQAFQMNKELYHNTDSSLENIEFLRSKILEFWTSPQEFFQKGLGYGIVYQNKIVSLCFSGFVAENVHGIDIETLEDHQGKKVGQKAARCFVEDCINKGMIPYWDCEETNKPSNAIAGNIGLEHFLNYFVYIFPMD